MYISKYMRDSIFKRAKRIVGKNPDLYREDAYGNVIHRNSYGRNSEMGWEIDHIRPVSKGGTDNIRNLQALQTGENRRKKDKYPYKKR